MKESYNNENLHLELVLKIRDFIDTMEEFQTTPLIQTEKGNQKGFAILSDNGNSNIMKRFVILVEDFKPNHVPEKNFESDWIKVCVEVDRSGIVEENMVLHYEFNVEPTREEILALLESEDIGYDDEYCSFNFYKI